MPERQKRIEKLRSALSRLRRLDGTLVHGVDGVWLIQIRRIRNPDVLLAACKQKGGPDRASLREGFDLAREPLAVTPALVAEAHRDLTRLENMHYFETQTRALGGTYRRLDRHWLARRRNEIEALGRRLASPLPTPPPGPWPAWLAVSLRLVADVRGETTAHRLSEFLETVASRWGALRQREQHRAAEKLVAHLLDRTAPTSLWVRSMGRYLVSLVDMREPRRTLRLGTLLKRFLRLAETWRWSIMKYRTQENRPQEQGQPDGTAMIGLVREEAERIILKTEAGIPANRREWLCEAAVFLTLAFAWEPFTDLSPRDVAYGPLIDLAVIRGLPSVAEGRRRVGVLEPIFGLRPAPIEVYILLHMGEEGRIAAEAVRLGVPLAVLRPLNRARLLPELAKLPQTADAILSYAKTVERLWPVLRNLGLSATASGLAISRLIALAKKGRVEAAFLAQCLMEVQRRRPAEVTPALLDNTLALLGDAPGTVRQILSSLTGPTTDLGRRSLPDYAEWLGDDRLLDQYLQLRQILGQPAGPSQRLTRDFNQVDSARRQVEFLEAQAAPTAGQLRALERARAVLNSAPSPDWTRRRLREEVERLLPEAYASQVDRALLTLLRDRLGISLSGLTPAWRDALRFYLGTRENDELLARILRFAAASPNRPIHSDMPANLRWIRRAQRHLDPAGWTEHRTRRLAIGGTPYRLETEERPLEILRMGVPFGTCLSLEDGFNAAATIIDAVDVNKKLIYLRDAADQIVARQLLAVSTDWKLLRYRIYSSLERPLLPAVEASFTALIHEIASTSRLPLAHSGQPEQLHEGFWYADPPTPDRASAPDAPDETEAQAAIASYALALGRPAPSGAPSHDERLEALGHQAMAQGDVEEACRMASAASGHPARQVVVDWVIDRLGLSAAASRARDQAWLGSRLILRVAEESPAELARVVDWMARRPGRHVLDADTLCIAEDAWGFLEAEPSRTEGLARLWAYSPFSSDYELSREIGRHVDVLPFGQALELCNRLERLRRYRKWARTEPEASTLPDEVGEGTVRSWMRDPDAAALLACLRRRSASPLALRSALSVLSVFPTADRDLTTVLDSPVSTPAPLSKALSSMAHSPRQRRSLEPLLEPLERAVGGDWEVLLRLGAKANPTRAVTAWAEARAAIQAGDGSRLHDALAELDACQLAPIYWSRLLDLGLSVPHASTLLSEPPMRWLCKHVVIDRIDAHAFARLWSFDGAREAILASQSGWRLQVRALRFLSSGGELGFIDRAIGQGDAAALADLRPEPMIRVSDLLTPEQWLEVYRGLPSLALKSRLLDRLASQPAERRQSIRRLALDESSGRELIPREWLLAALEGDGRPPA